MAKRTAAPRRKTTPNTTPQPSSAPEIPVERMPAPASGMTVRLYRQGHGDCLLLALRRVDEPTNDEPFYILIDCGMKKGSKLKDGPTIEQVAEHIRDSTGNRLDLVVVTHEHEDHVSGFLSEQTIFSQMTIEKLWMAWTENPEDRVANSLREQFKDTLIGLVGASSRLQAVNAATGASTPQSERLQFLLDNLLEGSIDADSRQGFTAATAKDKIPGITNKRAQKVLRDRAKKTEYLSPHQLAPGGGAAGYPVFVLGPPKNLAQLKEMEPRGDEEFHLAAAAADVAAFAAAFEETDGRPGGRPFDTLGIAAQRTEDIETVFKDLYGFNRDDYEPALDPPVYEPWRSIETDWLAASEAFALRMGDYVNNTSVVLAFQLPQSQKTLLFVGDAQSGNWRSWKTNTWEVEGKTLTIDDLLHRTVFYKVGHHGSHNATMNAGGLEEMAAGDLADEFVAMIPTHEQWALDVKPHPWVHPYPPILTELKRKARGRVIRLDLSLPDEELKALSAEERGAFRARYVEKPFYREYTVLDE